MHILNRLPARENAMKHTKREFWIYLQTKQKKNKILTKSERHQMKKTKLEHSLDIVNEAKKNRTTENRQKNWSFKSTL